MTTPPPRYTTAAASITEATVARAAQAWRAELERDFGTPRRSTTVLVAGTTAIGALIGVLPKIGGGEFMLATPLGFCAIGVILALLNHRRARAARTAVEARIAALGAGVQATLHTLSLDGPHRFVPHEHGVLVLVPLDATRCVTLDLSSVADDPRNAPVDAALRDGTVPGTWRWLETDTGEVLDFTMTGAPIVPVVGEEGWELDDDGLVRRVVEAMSEGQYVTALDFDALVATTAGRPDAR